MLEFIFVKVCVFAEKFLFTYQNTFCPRASAIVHLLQQMFKTDAYNSYTDIQFTRFDFISLLIILSYVVYTYSIYI